MHGTLTGKRIFTSYHGKRSANSNKLCDELYGRVGWPQSTSIPRTTGLVDKSQTDRQSERPTGPQFTLTWPRTFQTWSSESDSTRRQVSTFTVKFKTTDQPPMLWIESAKLTKKLYSRKMFQTSDTPTRSFKSQFRSEVVLNDLLHKYRQHTSCCYWRRDSIRWYRLHD